MLRQDVKWNWIGSGIISFFVVLSIFLVRLGQLPCIAALVIVVGVLLLAFVLFPYVSKYEIDPKDEEKE